MLIGRTKQIFYIKIQASSDNDRISFFKNKKNKKENKYLVMLYGISCFCLYVYTNKKSVYIVIKLIVHLQLSVSIIVRWLL